MVIIGDNYDYEFDEFVDNDDNDDDDLHNPPDPLGHGRLLLVHTIVARGRGLRQDVEWHVRQVLR